MDRELRADPKFIVCGLDGQRFRDQEWFDALGVTIRTPRGIGSAAAVVVGGEPEIDCTQFDQSLGWVVVVPPEGAFQAPLDRVLRRLGVVERQTLVVVLPERWRRGLELLEEMPGASFVWVIAPGDLRLQEGYPGVPDVENYYYRVHKQLLASRSAHTQSTLLIPGGLKLSPEAYGIAVVSYGEAIQFALQGGRRKLYLALAAAIASLVGGGRVDSAIGAVLGSGQNPPYERWLVELTGSGAVARASGFRLVLTGEGLTVYGFDARQSTLGLGWGSRRHDLVLMRRDGLVRRFRLGSLRREVIDTLSVSTEPFTNSYSAFATAGRKPVALSEIPSGEYQIHVIDEFDEDVLADSAHVVVEPDRVEREGRGYEVHRADGRWELVIRDLP